MAGRPLAVVTGASTGIGRELARIAAEDGCDPIIAADEPEIDAAAQELRGSGADVVAVEPDLGTAGGVEKLWQALEGRHLDYMLANAGRGLGHAFLDQDEDDIESLIHLNVTGTTAILHRAARKMRDQGEGRILVTG
ncbi:SDR family NAD(P)-dependent oxidoreductase [Palleronia sp.]|uniref:SDR family NAD(P)-dependent oxidoreductase n=1 Tax=Palleronia sp. TaxID=1940284 RepID=UPI0035C7D328